MNDTSLKARAGFDTQLSENGKRWKVLAKLEC